ncbi:MAG: nucleotidyltransferase domain-containing protein [Bacillota bacterium]
MNSKSELGKIRAIIGDCLRETNARVYLFGSWARGEARSGSDVDIAVDIAPDHAAKVGQLRECLEDSNVIYNCDIVNLSDSGSAVRTNVLKEGVEWKY